MVGCHFATGLAFLMALPDCTPCLHQNQQLTMLAWPELTGGSHGGFIFRRVKMEFFGVLGG
jgi:hypothetical protein